MKGTTNAIGSGIPDADAPNKVIVSNEQNKGEWQDAAPLAENLTPRPINNDALYTNGPTGGLADISTGQEAYLNEIRGYTIIWNQLVDSTHSCTLISSHYYIRYNNGTLDLITNSSSTIYSSSTTKIFDLTLMFGGNDKIPFSLSNVTNYPANGTLPAQVTYPTMAFARLFANVNFASCPYDEGTPKNVKATKLIETGRNLWNENDADMVANGLMLLAGYTYEIYLNGSTKTVNVSTDGGSTWTSSSYLFSRYTLANGKYIWTYQPTNNTLIKPYIAAIKYIGFVHSGNYCITTGTINNASYATTDATIPAYEKNEFNISGINGLNGVRLSNGTIVADTKDYTRVGHIADLSTLDWTLESSGWTATIPGIKPQTSGILFSKYEPYVVVNNNGAIEVLATSSPTGELFYELETPVATGNDPFEPIPLKAGNKWIVNDMGSEYFIQPENTNCPVNQLSIYYENLRDKLINFEIPEITLGSWNSSQTNMSAIKIGDVTFNLLPIGNNNKNISALAIGSSSLASSGNNLTAVGYSAGTGGSNATAIGSQSSAPNYCTSVGANAKCGNSRCTAIGTNAQAQNSYDVIAIGFRSLSYIKDAISFDGGSTSGSQDNQGGQRTITLYDTTKIFFRNEVPNGAKTSFEQHTSGHFLSEYIQNNTLVQESGTNKFYLTFTDSNNYTTFIKNVASGTATAIDKKVNGVHITVLLSTDAVVGLDLLLYDTNGHLSYGICDSSASVISAYIDSDGVVIVNPPAGVTVASVKYYLR